MIALMDAALIWAAGTSNKVEQPSGKLDLALWRLPTSFPEGQTELI
jgi:hypothetical protein